MTPGFLLAHAGGWDETLFVLTPIAIFASLLAVANSALSRWRFETSRLRASR